MAITTITSISGKTIRLTTERWMHIATEHPEMISFRDEILGTIQSPAAIYAGNSGEMLAIKPISADKWVVAVYREDGSDGFIITAFLTRRVHTITKRPLLWTP